MIQEIKGNMIKMNYWRVSGVKLPHKNFYLAHKIPYAFFSLFLYSANCTPL